jgi:hypothetical protein
MPAVMFRPDIGGVALWRVVLLGVTVPGEARVVSALECKADTCVCVRERGAWRERGGQRQRHRGRRRVRGRQTDGGDGVRGSQTVRVTDREAE